MSESGAAGAEGADREGLPRLEEAVSRLLREMGELRARNRKAEGRLRDLEELLARFREGKDDPVQLQDRLRRLREDNDELRERITEGRGGVDRLLARIRFLEEQQ